MDIIFKEDALFADPFTLSFFQKNEILNQSSDNFMGALVNNGLSEFIRLEQIIGKCMEEAPLGRPKDKMTWLYRRVRQQTRKILSL